ncbi:MAG: phage tail length tape measure family protein [Acetobacter orientalis]|uniref:phage tail length tape measure family protein n=1 Tax=Acetobacter orientalis TaxID=146474 RepID=UPI0039E9F857
MPTIEELRVSYASNVETVAKRDAQALNNVADAAEVVDQKITRTTKSGLAYVNRFDAVTKSANALAKAQKELEAAQTAVDTALAKGSVTTEQAERALEGLRDRVSQASQKHKEAQEAVSGAAASTDTHTVSVTKNTGAIKLQSYQVAQVADEFHKWVDQVLAGGSALTATTYQLPNMVQAMGGLGNATKLVGGFLAGPGGLVLAAGAAGLAFAKMGTYAESEQENLAQLSQRLRATRDDYADMSDAAEKAARSLHDNSDGLSLSDSRSATQTIAAVPTVDSSQLKRLTADARDLATVMGATVPDAAKTLASALQDPAKAAQDFEQQGLSGFNAGLVLSVQHMQQAGDRSGALASVMNALETSVSGAANRSLTPFQKALHSLKDEAGGVGEVVQQTFEHMGDGIVSMSTSGINALKDLVAEIKALPDQLEPVADSIWDTVSSAASWAGGVLNSGVQAIVPSTLAHLMQQGSTPDPVFQSPSSAPANNSSVSPSVQELDARSKAVTSLSAHFADLKKTVDENIGSDSSLSGQTEDQRRKIEGLSSAVAALKELHAAGRISEADYTDGMRNLNGQITAANVALVGLRGPFVELIEQQQRATQSAAALTGYDKAMAEAAQQADDAARSLSGGLASASEKAQVQAAAARTLAAEYSTATSVMQRHTAMQGQIVSAWSEGGAAAQHATNYVQAYTEALDHYKSGSAAFVQAVTARTQALDAQYVASQKIDLAKNTFANDNQLKLIGLENSSLGMNADARALLIARMQSEQEELQKGNSLQDQSVQAYLNSKDAVLEASQAYQHHEQVLSDVTGSISSMADTLTNDLTQGFVQGTAHGISFKNILSGIETQIGGLVIKMGLINPLLNKIDGGTRTTLSDINQVLGSSSSSSSSSGLSSQQIAQYTGSDAGLTSDGQVIGSNGLTAAEAQQFFGSGTNVTGSLFGNTGQSLQIGNDNNPFAGSGIAAGGSSINLGDFTGSSSASSTTGFGSLSDMFSGNGGLMSDSGQAAVSTTGGAASAVGGLIGGFTIGSKVGKMAGNLTGGGKGGKIGAQIGAGVGSVVGGIFGGPIGSMIGGVVLGAIGGIIGGLFNKKHYVYDAVSGSDGQLVISGSRTKHASDDVRSGLQTDLDTINAVYSDSGITVADQYYGEVGHYHKGKHYRSTSLEDLLPGVKLHSDDANENLALQQIMPDHFDSVSSYTQAIESIAQLAQTLDALHVSVSKFNDASHLTVDTITGYTGDVQKVLSGFNGKIVSDSALQSEISTVKELVGVTSANAESLVDQVADLRDKYKQAADQAKRYGLDYQIILDKGNAIAQQMITAEQVKLAQSNQSVQARYLAATGDQEGADLVNADISADQQRQQLRDEWQSYYGDSYATNADYQKQMLDLDKTLAAERLKIQQTYADQAAQVQKNAESSALQSVTSVFQNLASYTHDLATSDVSPLSVQEQYGVANDNLTSDYNAAMGGDYDAFSRLQSDAQTELSLSKNWYGSGTGYTDDYKRVLTMLQNIGNFGPDTFTATLAKTLINQNTDATLQVKKAIQDMQASITAELRQFIRVQAAKAA